MAVGQRAGASSIAAHQLVHVRSMACLRRAGRGTDRSTLAAARLVSTTSCMQKGARPPACLDWKAAAETTAATTAAAAAAAGAQ